MSLIVVALLLIFLALYDLFFIVGILFILILVINHRPLLEVLIDFTGVVGLDNGRFIHFSVVDVADCLEALVLMNDLLSVRLATALVSSCLLWLWCRLSPALLLLLFRCNVAGQVDYFFLGDLMVL